MLIHTLSVFPPFASLVCCLHRNEVTNHDVTRHDVTKALVIRMPHAKLVESSIER